MRKRIGVLFYGLMCAVQAGYADVLWKPSDISFRIYQSHPALKMGLMLELNQQLEEGEFGWTQSRYDIPENWGDASVDMIEGVIVISTKGERFYIDAVNQGPLQFYILNGGVKSDAELLGIWRKHAQYPAH